MAESAPSPERKIDSTPTGPKPPANQIDLAERDIPRVMANIQPDPYGTIALNADHLAHYLVEAGHTLAAAKWAVHESIKAGRLKKGFKPTSVPSSSRPRGKPNLHGLAAYAIPEGSRTPFELFRVIATESLWDWWRELENNATGHISTPSSPAPQKTEQLSDESNYPGFLGGKDLAILLGIHPTRIEAFCRKLDRIRLKLDNDSWHEVSEPRPNAPRFLYRVDSPEIQAISAAYKHPKGN